MRVLFGFRDAQLFESRGGDDFTEHVGQVLRCEDRLAGVGRIILGERVIRDLRGDPAIKAVEIGLQECIGQFAGAVGAEVEEQHHVAIADALFARVAQDHRRHELIGLVQAVLIGHGFAG